MLHSILTILNMLLRPELTFDLLRPPHDQEAFNDRVRAAFVQVERPERITVSERAQRTVVPLESRIFGRLIGGTVIHYWDTPLLDSQGVSRTVRVTSLFKNRREPLLDSGRIKAAPILLMSVSLDAMARQWFEHPKDSLSITLLPDNDRLQRMYAELGFVLTDEATTDRPIMELRNPQTVIHFGQREQAKFVLALASS